MQMTPELLHEPAVTSDKAAGAARGLFGSTVLAGGLCILIANCAIVLLICLSTRSTSIPFQRWMQFAMVAAILLISVFMCAHLYLHWIKPHSRAEDLLRQIRLGEATIEQLGAIHGGIKPLLAGVQEVLRDLRRQKAEIARIELETHQRVANRTDALERSLGAVRQQAAKDVLTGLLNRRALEISLPETFNRCRAESVPLSIMMIDVDDFKLLNDTLGHAAGDAFLRSLGQLVRSTLRETDLAFRYGGDEFVILLPNQTQAHAAAVGTRLTSLADGLTNPMCIARPPRLSIGLLSSDDLPRDASAKVLLDEADRLLYRVKQARKAGRTTSTSKTPVGVS